MHSPSKGRLLVAVGKVIASRDALENNGNLHEDVDGTVEILLVVFVIVTASEVVDVEEFLLAA